MDYDFKSIVPADGVRRLAPFIVVDAAAAVEVTLPRVAWDEVCSYLVAEEQMRHALTAKRFLLLYFWGSPQDSNAEQRALAPLALNNLKLVVKRRTFFFTVEGLLDCAIHGNDPENGPRWTPDKWRMWAKAQLRSGCGLPPKKKKS